MKRSASYVMIALAAALAGCAALSDNLVHVKESQQSNPNASKIKYAASIRIAGYVDGRGESSPRKLGIAEAKVSGMSGNDIMLDRDAADIVVESLRKRLDETGIRILEKDDASALFELSGVIKELKVDVKFRDYANIKLETTLTEIATGKVVWAGEVEQKNDRYAGVSGNSKSDIASYLKQQLGIVTGKTTEAVNSVLMATRPELFSLTPGTKVIEGVKVLVTPGVTTPVPTAPTPTMPDASNGQLSVRTEPARAKVYMDGVYYGLSPIHVEATPGIHKVEARLKGYRAASEKVAVRKGDTTELELQLEK